MNFYKRHACLWLAALSWAAGGACAAGFERLTIPATAGQPALQAVVWTPCAQAAVPMQLGPFSVAAVKNCPVEGTALPLVVLSHGQGGSPLGHYDTAMALADAGFVAISIKHAGDAFDDKAGAKSLSIFASRPRDVSAAISFMLTGWHAHPRIAAEAVGVYGFSRGGYTALALAGATPSRAASAERFCGSWTSVVFQLCREIRWSNTPLQAQPDPRVRAVVVADPLNLFDAAGLQKVRIPVQLWASELGGDGVTLAHTEAVKAALPHCRPPRPTVWHAVQGTLHTLRPARLRSKTRSLTFATTPQALTAPRGTAT